MPATLTGHLCFERGRILLLAVRGRAGIVDRRRSFLPLIGVWVLPDRVAHAEHKEVRLLAAYRKLLGKALDHPWRTIAISVVAVAGGIGGTVLLTALAAILGMVPIAHQVFWGPMAYAIIGWLTGATVLTLTLLPTVLRLLLAREASATTRSDPLTDEEPDGMALQTLELNEAHACGK